MQPAFRYEHIELPPGFAKTLPPGDEELYFSPGMFDPASEGYWSYVFALVWDKPGAGSVQHYTTLFNTYYRGLINAVGTGKYDVSQIQAQFRAGPAAGTYVGTVDVFDAFKTGNKLQVKLRLTEGTSCVMVLASPQPPDHPIWQTLSSAATCLPCPEAKE